MRLGTHPGGRRQSFEISACCIVPPSGVLCTESRAFTSLPSRNSTPEPCSQLTSLPQVSSPAPQCVGLPSAQNPHFFHVFSSAVEGCQPCVAFRSHQLAGWYNAAMTHADITNAVAGLLGADPVRENSCRSSCQKDPD